MTGFGGDLASALTQAAGAVESDTAELVQRMYPLAELARLEEGDNMARLLHRINSVPSMKAAMIRDLQEAAKAAPTMEQNNQVAVYELPPLVEGDAPRIIKFQNVDGNWRFFDGAVKYREESHRLASLPMKRFVVPGSKGVMSLIKKDGRWRLQGQPRVISDDPNSPAPGGARAVPAERSF